MNNNNRMIYILILSAILILVGTKLIKTPTDKLVKYTGFGMVLSGTVLMIIEFNQNKKSIVDSTLSSLGIQSTTPPSPMASGPMPAKSPAKSPAKNPAKSPAKSPKDPEDPETISSNEPPKNSGMAFLLTLAIIGMGLTFIL